MSSVVNNILGGGSTGGLAYKPQGLTQDQLNQQYQQTQAGLLNQQNFLTALQGQNGIQNQSNVYNQLQGVANGTGPNPAQAQLAQSTGANVANQAALMAGQRGSGANAGLIARQAAMQGANTQQQAAGQAATLQANQSLNALGAMGNIAGQQVGNQANAVNSYANTALGGEQAVMGSVNNQNTVSGGLAQEAAKQQGNVLSGIAGAAGSALELFAEGGQVTSHGPQSKVGQHFHGKSVPVLLSPGEIKLSPKEAKEVAKGKDPMKVGEKIPGQAKVSGNSYANDTYKTSVKPGTVIVPRSETQSKDPSHNSAKFVQAVMARKGMR